MSDVVDLRAAVRALATPQELAQLRPAAYELTPPIVTTSLVRRRRVRLPKLGPFIVTSLGFPQEYEFLEAVRFLVDDSDLSPPRSISEGDIPIDVLRTQGDGTLGDDLPAPFYVKDGRSLILEAVMTDAANADPVSCLVEGFHVPESLLHKVQHHLGELFLLALTLAAGDDSPTEWEVPDNAHLVLDFLHVANPVVGVDPTLTTATLLHMQVAGFDLWPLGFTRFDALSQVAGQQTMEPHLALHGGDSIVITPDTVSADVIVVASFTREL